MSDGIIFMVGFAVMGIVLPASFIATIAGDAPESASENVSNDDDP